MRVKLSDLNNFVRAYDLPNAVLLQDAILLSVPELSAMHFNLNSDVLVTMEFEDVVTLLKVVNAQSEVLSVAFLSHFDLLEPVSEAMPRQGALNQGNLASIKLVGSIPHVSNWDFEFRTFNKLHIFRVGPSI